MVWSYFAAKVKNYENKVNQVAYFSPLRVTPDNFKDYYYIPTQLAIKCTFLSMKITRLIPALDFYNFL